MTLDQTFAAVTAVGIAGPILIGAVWWIGNLQTRLKHAEERIGDLRSLVALPAALEGLGKDVAHGLEMIGVEMRGMNDRFVEHTAQDEKRFDQADARHEEMMSQLQLANRPLPRRRRAAQ